MNAKACIDTSTDKTTHTLCAVATTPSLVLFQGVCVDRSSYSRRPNTTLTFLQPHPKITHTHTHTHTHTLTGVEGDELGIDDCKSTPDLFELPLQVKRDRVIRVYTNHTRTPSVNTLTATSTWSVPRSFCLWISSKKYLLFLCRL